MFKPFLQLIFFSLVVTCGLQLRAHPLGTETTSLAPMLEKITPAVVNVSAQQISEVRRSNPFWNLFSYAPSPSIGSGLIIDAEEGLVITNHHVIQNGSDIRVTLSDQRVIDAEILGSDEFTDVAVLKIDAKNLHALELANSDDVRVGDFVVAVGNPFGIGQTVTMGIVGALGRTTTVRKNFEEFIQTDASINPGNSGGPLVTVEGKVIGINTAIVAPSGGSVGIGFAIPSNMAKEVVSQLIQHGSVDRGLLGVAFGDVTPFVAEQHGLEGAQGAIITDIVEGSEADLAGLKVDDIVVNVDQKPVANSTGFRNVIGLKRVGDEFDIDVVRNGKPITVSAKIGKPLTEIDGITIDPTLAGITFKEITTTSRRYGTRNYIEISKIEPESNVYRRGIRAGDVVVAVNNRIRVESLSELTQIANQSGVDAIRFARGDRAYVIFLDDL